MDPIATLMTEHRTIARVLAGLEAWTERVVGDGGDDRPTLAAYVRFLREYVDRRHHGKEERLLFEAMSAHGVARDHGPIAVMVGEHGAARTLADVLEQLAVQPEPWTGHDRGDLERGVSQYAALLRDHIQTEDEVVYPMARARLPAAAMTWLAQGFAAVDPPAPDELDALAAALAG